MKTVTTRNHAHPEPADRTDAIERDPLSSAATVFLVVSVVGVVAWAAFTVMQGPAYLVGFVADDAFYYFKIARNIAATGHSFFDTTGATNGYHPAWMIVLICIALLVHGKIAFLRTAVAAAIGLHIVSGVVLYRAAIRLAPPTWAKTIAGAWIACAFALSVVLTGVESALVEISVFALAIAVIDAVKRGSEGLPILPGRARNEMALLLAFAIWTRTDQALLAMVTMLLLLVLSVRPRPSSGEAGQLVKSNLFALAITAGMFLIAVAPIPIVSWLTVHSLQQDSAAMKMLWTKKLLAQPGAPSLPALAWFQFTSFWLGVPIRGLVLGTFKSYLTPLTVAVLSVAAIAIAMAARSREPDKAPAMTVIVWLLAAIAVSGAAFSVLITDYQVWHSAATAAQMALIAGIATGVLLKSISSSSLRRTLSSIGFAAVALITAVCWRNMGDVPYPWQRDVLSSQAAFEKLVPPADRIGCFNAGIPAYFSDRDVIDLDGLVDHTALTYWRRDRFDDFLRDENILYIADESQSLGVAIQFSNGPIHLRRIATAPLTGMEPMERTLWRVEN
jgi:hypothetical protein